MHLNITCVRFVVNNYIDKVSGGSLQIDNVNSTVNKCSILTEDLHYINA